LTSTVALDSAVELRCPTQPDRPADWRNPEWERRCNRLLAEVAPIGVPFQVSLVCPRCHRRTTFHTGTT
jgi:hypothetical protein